MGLGSWLWIPESGFLGSDSWVWIPGFGFLCLGSWVWILGFGFLGLESWAWIPGFGVLGLKSWAWIPGFGLLARTFMKTISKPMRFEPNLQILGSPGRKFSRFRGKAAWKPNSFYKPFISRGAHCNSLYRGRVDWKTFL